MLDGLRLAVTQEGWLRLQEGAVSVLAVIAWRTNPVLLGAVVLLVISFVLLAAINVLEQWSSRFNRG